MFWIFFVFFLSWGFLVRIFCNFVHSGRFFWRILKGNFFCIIQFFNPIVLHLHTVNTFTRLILLLNIMVAGSAYNLIVLFYSTGYDFGWMVIGYVNLLVDECIFCDRLLVNVFCMCVNVLMIWWMLVGWWFVGWWYSLCFVCLLDDGMMFEWMCIFLF